MQPHIYTNAVLATVTGTSSYGLIQQGALVFGSDRILYAGPQSDLPDSYAGLLSQNLGGRLVTPGLIDCHTHLIYGGSRAEEFEMRLNGASYEDIARAGGGIMSTVKATREASDDQLLSAALTRLDNLITEGVTTVEIKSGYGLNRETELRMLRLARKLETLRPVRISTTYLGAHAIPKDMSADEYMDVICISALREAHSEGLVDMVDGFCENIAFSPAQIKRLFKVAQELGLPVKLHAEQLSPQGGTSLAAKYGALSAEHLEYVTDDDIAAMAKAGTVATLLPGAFYFLKETKKPPIDKFRQAGIAIAISTDSNPGSSPMSSILLAMNMGATLFGLTPEECLRGVTVNAAKALGLKDTGTLAEGQRADIAIWDVAHPAELTYRMGDAPLYKRFFGGAEC